MLVGEVGFRQPVARCFPAWLVLRHCSTVGSRARFNFLVEEFSRGSLLARDFSFRRRSMTFWGRVRCEGLLARPGEYRFTDLCAYCTCYLVPFAYASLARVFESDFHPFVSCGSSTLFWAELDSRTEWHTLGSTHLRISAHVVLAIWFRLFMLARCVPTCHEPLAF